METTKLQNSITKKTFGTVFKQNSKSLRTIHLEISTMKIDNS